MRKMAHYRKFGKNPSGAASVLRSPLCLDLGVKAAEQVVLVLPQVSNS